MGVRVQQQAILAKLLGLEKGIDRPNGRSLTFAQYACQFIATLPADGIEATDNISE